MNYKLPFTMEGKGEDLFFLSNGHISPVYYSTLARFDFFPVEELNTFRKLNSRLQSTLQLMKVYLVSESLPVH